MPKLIKEYVKQHLEGIYKDFAHLWTETNNKLIDNLTRSVYSVLHTSILSVSANEQFSDDHEGLSVPFTLIQDKAKPLFIDKTIDEQDYRLPAFEAWDIDEEQRREFLSMYYDFMIQSVVHKLCKKRKTIELGRDSYFFMFFGKDFYRIEVDEYQTHTIVKFGKLCRYFEEPSKLEAWLKKWAICRSWKKNKGTLVKPIVHVDKDGKLKFELPS